MHICKVAVACNACAASISLHQSVGSLAPTWLLPSSYVFSTTNAFCLVYLNVSHLAHAATMPVQKSESNKVINSCDFCWLEVGRHHGLKDGSEGCICMGLENE